MPYENNHWDGQAMLSGVAAHRLIGKSILWIDWGCHLRSQTLSQRLGAELVEICFGGTRLWRYIRSTFKTKAVLQKKRPDIVIATNPSIVLNYLMLVLRKWHGFKLISDAHYFGVVAANGHPLLQRLLDFHNSKADLVIVTNNNHARLLDSLGTRTYICPDPLPYLPVPSRATMELPEKSVLLICSFNVDEPYEAVFTAFSSLQKQGYSLFVSGNYQKAQIDISRFPWVNFLGFLPEREYYEYLRACTLVMDLTTMEDCLVCGAYEALAAGKPLVLSKTNALSNYFGDAAVLTENTAAAIRESVLTAYIQRDELVRKAEDWVARNQLEMNERIKGLKSALLSLASKPDSGNRAKR